MKNELNSAFSAYFTAVRQTDVRYTLPELATMRVTFMDRLLQHVGHSRAERKKLATIGINFMQHLAPAGAETRQDVIDDLTELVETVMDHFPPGGVFSEYRYAKLVEVGLAGNEPRIMKDLQEADVFNSSIAMTFHVVEAP